MTYLDRVLADSSNREAWLHARESVIGASDAAMLSKPESLDRYLAAKLAPAFAGNRHTDSGNRWEPMMLAWAGIPACGLLIHHPDEIGFAATPDGADGVRLAECKAKEGRIITGPSLAEWRQVAWQLYCIPEAESVEWIWAETLGGDLAGREPKSITITRDHPKVRDLTARIVPIAVELLLMLRHARSAPF